MRPFRLLLTLILGGLAVRQVMSQHRSAPRAAGVDENAASPNAAERLQSQGLAATPGDGAPPLFPGPAQSGPFAQSTGLADFTRGA